MADTINAEQSRISKLMQRLLPGKPAEPSQSTYRQWLLLVIASIIVAGTVAVGEALVAVFFAGTFVVFIPAFIISFVLFRMDTFYLFEGFANHTLGKDIDKETKEIKSFTGWKKIVLKVALAIALFGGAACGFLQLNSILVSFGGLFWGLSAAAAVAAPPLSLIIIAVFVATVSGIANAALLYMNVEKFIKEEQYLDYYKSLRDIFSPSSGKSILWRTYHGLFAVAGLTAAVVIYLVTLGLYKAQAMSVFNLFLNCSLKTSGILTNLIVHPGQILNGFFYMRNLVNLIRDVETGFKEYLLKKILPKSWQDVAKPEENAANNQMPQSVDEQPTWKDAACIGVSLVAYMAIFYCASKNGAAQGQGALNEPMSWTWLMNLKVPESITKPLVYGVMSLGSFAGNFKTSLDETALHPATFMNLFKSTSALNGSLLQQPVPPGSGQQPLSPPRQRAASLPSTRLNPVIRLALRAHTPVPKGIRQRSFCAAENVPVRRASLSQQ